MRLVTVSVPESAVEDAIARGLLTPEDSAKGWSVIQSCYAALLSDPVLDRLVNGGLITREQRADAGAILRSIQNLLLGGYCYPSEWLEQTDA